MKMKKLIMVLAISTLALTGLVACGGEEVTEDVVTEDVVVEEDVVEEDATEEVASVIEVPVTINNATGVEIYELYVSGGANGEWGDDLLGDVTFPDATSIDLVLYVDSANLLWDMSAIDSEGVSVDFYGIDITEMPADGFAIDLTFDGTTATATAYNPNGDVAASEVDLADPADLSSALAGSVWIDDELTTYGFETDGTTLYVVADDTEYVGEYAFVADESGAVVLGMSIPELEAEIYFVVTEIGDDYLTVMDFETGTESVLAYVTAVE